jgi:ribosome biogenesis GTPase A
LQQQEEHEQQQLQQQQAEDSGRHLLPQQVFWTDGKTGSGVHSLRRAALKLSDHINAKRAKRGLAPRPVRACVIGFPNIGKSALINRLLGRRVVESAARPGVTRVLR